MFRLIAFLPIMLLFGIAPAAARQGPLVLAAASLQEALTDAADAWARRGHPRPRLSFAASSVLARQVIAGAPADLFISADEEWMDELAKRGLIQPSSRNVIAGNRLVLIAGKDRRAPIRLGRGAALRQWLGDDRLAIADPASVPAGRYARAALERLAIWRSVEPRIVRAENVRAALALVERGAAGAGIVYATDARASADVSIAGVFPASAHPPIRYPIARLMRSEGQEAEAFRRFLLSPAGKAIFTRRGFSAP